MAGLYSGRNGRSWPRSKIEAMSAKKASSRWPEKVWPGPLSVTKSYVPWSTSSSYWPSSPEVAMPMLEGGTIAPSTSVSRTPSRTTNTSWTCRKL